jgi:molybdopterin-biosynthesis enzyme MoeA-like protein
MLGWVLEQYYPADEATTLCERSLRVTGVPGSELLELMERLAQEFPAARLFSLPRYGEPASIELGFRGEQPDVNAAVTALAAALRQRRMAFETVVAA